MPPFTTDEPGPGPHSAPRFGVLAAVSGTAGADWIHVAGDGHDPAAGTNEIALATDQADTILAGAGSDVVFAGGGDDRVESGTNGSIPFRMEILYGGDGNDTLVAGSGSVLYGGAGADTFTVSGAGYAIVRYDDADWGDLTISLFDPALNTGSAAGDTYTGVREIYGGAGNNSIAGNIALYGLDGNDTLTGGVTGNGLYGGTGNDRLAGNDGYDTLYGGAGDDLLEGGAANDWLHGEEGTDTLIGGDGNDTYFIDAGGGDVIVEEANGGSDTFISSFSLTAAANIENYWIQGGLDADVTGNELDNRITGNTGDNTLIGGGGNDTIYAGRGHDDLRGGDGEDVLWGRQGADTMRGGAGNDLYISDGRDTIIEGLNGGIDTIQAGKDFSLAAFPTIERLDLGSRNAVDGTGNDLANFLRGNAYANVLDGGLGNDTLCGGQGSDVLIGGKGADLMNGGAGATDIFRFATSGTGADRIVRFETALDRFDLSGGAFTALVENGGDTKLVHDGGTVLIDGVTGLTLAQWNALVLPSGSDAGGTAFAQLAFAGDALSLVPLLGFANGDWAFA